MRELYKFMIWLALALIFMGVMLSSSELIYSENTNTILVISFIAGLICSFLAEYIVNKFNK